MKKEMFNHEINILRDTYRRLLRRQAKTNLIKLTRKTHPADLATLFRHFTIEEQKEIFALMKENERTAEFLTELDDSLVNELLSNENLEQAFIHILDEKIILVEKKADFKVLRKKDNVSKEEGKSIEKRDDPIRMYLREMGGVELL